MAAAFTIFRIYPEYFGITSHWFLFSQSFLICLVSVSRSILNFLIILFKIFSDPVQVLMHQNIV
ncbi:hypothetical protein BO224_12385 [Erysipelotrichaceae bacterium NYU-BL-E8]|uniref:Uncharacterized protein n=1 Tax=Ileibacterium valens TaxID=1862668 RepID=A0A1U7NHN9_9FIRM|nr:hypothetical protein BO224_12385 [Erysipelotrichaceae bacterium NYU-BL-E8]OLU38843.1 hypothetical protein BM735_08645 [Erysipelotrichaceae bacterium NYU-BL-F16]OLU41529.1 hypothetical protein BO222_03285 [Ileibacterium valens]